MKHDVFFLSIEKRAMLVKRRRRERKRKKKSDKIMNAYIGCFHIQTRAVFILARFASGGVGGDFEKEFFSPPFILLATSPQEREEEALFMCDFD